jgi:hypothetical protein
LESGMQFRIGLVVFETEVDSTTNRCTFSHFRLLSSLVQKEHQVSRDIHIPSNGSFRLGSEQFEKKGLDSTGISKDHITITRVEDGIRVVVLPDAELLFFHTIAGQPQAFTLESNEQMELYHGDVIQIGRHQFSYSEDKLSLEYRQSV